MVCNDLVMPLLLRTAAFGARGDRAGVDAAGDLTGMLLGIRRVAIVVLLLLGYLYFRIAGEAYALVSIGLISFAAVAQFAPALLGGMYWKGGTREGALAGLGAGFALWIYTLMLPSIAKSGWMDSAFLTQGLFGWAWLKPEQLFGLTRLDPLTHSLFWSLLANGALYIAVSLRRPPTAREMSQALLFVDAMRHPPEAGAQQPVFWRGTARVADLQALAQRFLGADAAQRLFAEHARRLGVERIEQIPADARLVQLVESQLAGAIGSASARVMVASTVQEDTLAIDDVMRILDEASREAMQLRAYSHELEQKSRSLAQAGAELRAANEQLKSLDKLKDDFMSSVTHELRTPLTSIRALAELMVDDPDMSAEQRQQFTAIIVAETERLSRLVNQVLDMAKIESGHAEWHTAPVDLQSLAEAAVQTTRELFRERGAQVELHTEPGLPVLRCDADRLTQVMMNLLSNAAKFVPQGRGRVQVRMRRSGDAVRVEVHDNGPGVPAEQQGLIFEKFRQGGDEAHRPQGTGLGLPISRQIVEHFGGRMGVTSTPGEGSCFHFELPLALAVQETA
jgi:signal transduction histidine kinase